MFQITYHLTVTIEADLQGFAEETMAEFPKMLTQIDKDQMEPIRVDSWKIKLKRWKKLKETYRYTYLVIAVFIEENIPTAEKRVEDILKMLQLNENVKEVTYKQHGEALSVGAWKK